MFLKSSVKFTQSVMIWAAMSSAGVGPLCFLKSSQRSHLPGHFQPSIECIEMNILFGNLTFMFKISFFIDM